MRKCFGHHPYCRSHAEQPKKPGCRHVEECDIVEKAGDKVVAVTEEEDDADGEAD